MKVKKSTPIFNVIKTFEKELIKEFQIEIQKNNISPHALSVAMKEVLIESYLMKSHN